MDHDTSISLELVPIEPEYTGSLVALVPGKRVDGKLQPDLTTMEFVTPDDSPRFQREAFAKLPILAVTVYGVNVPCYLELPVEETL